MSCGLTPLLRPDCPLCLQHTGDGRTESVLNSPKASFLTISAKHEKQVHAVPRAHSHNASSCTHAWFNQTLFVGINWLTYCDVLWSSSGKNIIGNYWGRIGVVHTLVAKGADRQCRFSSLKISINMYPNSNAAELDTRPVRKDIIPRGSTQGTVCCMPESVIYCTVLHVSACRPSSSRDST